MIWREVAKYSREWGFDYDQYMKYIINVDEMSWEKYFRESYESNSDEIEEIEQKLNFSVTFDLRKFNKNYIKV